MRSRGRGLLAFSSLVLMLAVIGAVGSGAALADTNLKYHGGPVLSHPATSYVIYWQGTTGTLSADYTSDVAQFIQDWSETPAHGVLTQYYQRVSGKEYVSNVVKYGGMTTDSSPFPRQVLTAGELAHEVRLAVQQRGWPQGYGANYVVLLPPQESTDVNACAWHNWVPDTPSSKKIFYSIIPYYNGSQACPMPGGPYPHGEDIDNAIDRVSHELSELATDPWNTELAHDPNQRTNTSWYIGTGSHEKEVGDLCRQSGHGVYGPRSAATGADVVLHGHPYLIQEEWSNALGACSLDDLTRHCGVLSLQPAPQTVVYGIAAFGVSCGVARAVAGGSQGHGWGTRHHAYVVDGFRCVGRDVKPTAHYAKEHLDYLCSRRKAWVRFSWAQ